MSKKNSRSLSRIFKWFPIDIDALRLFRARAYGALRRLLNPVVRLAKRPRPKSQKPKVVNWVPQVEQLEVRQMPSTITWVGGGGDNNWTTAANWSGSAVPGTGDSVVISSGTVDLNTNAQIVNLTFSSGTLNIEAGSLQLSGSGSTWSGGTITGVNFDEIQLGASLTISGAVTLDGPTLDDEGTINWTGGDISLDDGACLQIGSSAVFNVECDANLVDIGGGSSIVVNYGTFEKTTTTGTTNIEASFDNDTGGVVDQASGTIEFSTGDLDNAGTVTGATINGATVSGSGGVLSGVTVTSGTVATGTFTGTSSWTGGGLETVTIDSGATLNISGAGSKSLMEGNLANYGDVNWTQGDISAGSYGAYIGNNSGATFSMSGSVNLTGDGTYFSNDGTLSVGTGGSASTDEIGGSFDQGSTGTTNVAIQSLTGSAYSQLQIDDEASLDGTLNIQPLSGLSVSNGDVYPVITASSFFGTFASETIGSFGSGMDVATTFLSSEVDGDIAPPLVSNSQGSDASNSQPVTVSNSATVNPSSGNVTIAAVGATLNGSIAGVDYNSDAADPLPTMNFSVPTSGSDPVPTSIEVQLTWNGTPQGWQSLYMPVGSVAGDTYDVAVQDSSPVTTTGDYPYTVQVRINYSTKIVDRVVIGNDFVVAGASSPYGAGWSLPDENYLVFDGSNVAMVSGTGNFAYFTDTSGTYTFTPNMGQGDDPSVGSGTFAASGSTYIYTDLNQVQWNYNNSGQLTSIVQPTGQTTTYGYTSGLLTSIVKPGNWEDVFAYSGGLLSSIKDGYNDGTFHATATSTFAYDGSDNLTSVTDAAGNTRTFTYDGNLLQTDSNQDTTLTYAEGAASAVSLGGGLSTIDLAPQLVEGLPYDAVLASDFNAQITNGDGNTTTEYLDAYGRPLSIVSPTGATQSWTYDATTGMPLTYTDANGNVTTWTYVTDTRNVHTVVTPDNLTTTYDYGSTWNTPTTVIDGYGRTTTYSYDGTTGQLLSTTYPDSSSTSNTYSGGLLQTSVDADGHTTFYYYDSHDEVTAVVDPDEHTTLYAYDLATGTVTTTQPSGETSVSTYNADEQLISQVDFDGNTALTYYTADGQVSATVDGLGHTAYYDYDAADRVTATIDTDGHTTVQMYDGAGNVTATVDANGITAYQYYDGNGNVTETIDANGNTTLNDYDSTGLLTATVDGNGHTAYQDYSSTGLLTATVDANGHTTLYDYDSHRRLTATIDPDHRTTVQIYDSYGNVTATIDGNGITSHQYFDAGDRVTATVDGNGHTSYTDYDAAGNVTATIDADSHTSLTMYDPDGNVTATVDGDHKTSYMEHDLDGRLTATIDADNHTSLQYYDGNGNATATVDANGYTSYQYYDRDGRVTAAVDADTHTSLTMYDHVGNVIATVDADGKTSYQDFDPNGNITATVDANGHTAYQYYDHDGNVTAMIDADGHTSQQLYDRDSRVTATIDGNGYTSYTLYDHDGNVTSTVSGAGNTSFQLYDPAGQLTAMIDGNGHTSLTYYDGDGQVTATVDYNGHTSYQYYDHAGQVTATVDADGYTSYQEFDHAGNVTVSIDADGYTTQQAFDGDNRLTQVIDNGGQTATYSFDAAGNLTQSINLDGYTTQQAFDGDGNVTQTIDTTGHTSNQYYDHDGQLTMSIDGDRDTTYQRFDPDGRITATIDGRGYTSLQMYDADGNVTASVDGDGDTTQFQYDKDGNQTAVIDPDLNTTTMAFDADGHVTETIASFGGTTLQYYDGDGSLTQTINPDTSSIVYSYDHDDRQTQQLWYDSGSTLVDTQSKSYDNDGDLLTASNTNGTYTFAYDHDGRLTNVQEPFGVSLSYAYDGDGNQTQVVDSFGGTQTSVYDLQDRLVTREYTGESQELRVDFTYGANGQVNTETRYTDLSGPAYMAGTDVVAVTDTDYDADGNVTSIQSVDSSSTVIDAFTYTYDPAGNLQNETDTQQGVTTTTSYSYDDANQLLSAGTLSYSYDANGNRPNADASTVTDNQVSNDANWTYSYDANGNLSEKDTTTALSDEHWTYAYNNKNELTEVKHYDSSNSLELTVDYQYDVFGNLIEEAATTGAGTTTTKFAVDGWNSNMAPPIGLENFNDWAVLNSGNTLQTRNLFSDKVDQVLGRVDQTGASDAAGQYWALTDHLGSVRDVVDSSGTLKDSVAYDAYGNVIGTELNQNYRGMYAWTGRQVDLETGLQYNRARWYDNTTGRWISQDPMGFDAGDSNLYRYVHNAPTTHDDPSGEFVLNGPASTYLDNPNLLTGKDLRYIDSVISSIGSNIWEASSQLRSYQSSYDYQMNNASIYNEPEHSRALERAARAKADMVPIQRDLERLRNALPNAIKARDKRRVDEEKALENERIQRQKDFQKCRVGPAPPLGRVPYIPLPNLDRQGSPTNRLPYYGPPGFNKVNPPVK
jgi:RHS repeat-associated protein